MPLSDGQIRRYVEKYNMIVPFEPYQVRSVVDRFRYGIRKAGVLSYGTSSYGYDIRLAHELWIFQPNPTTGAPAISDPKSFDPAHLQKVKMSKFTGGYGFILPPHTFALAQSMETFNIPRNILALVVGKSTYARCGLMSGYTPVEPEWRGELTLELANVSPIPIKLYAGEGIGQMIFFNHNTSCDTSYNDVKGEKKYQDQKGIQTSYVGDED